PVGDAVHAVRQPAAHLAAGYPGLDHRPREGTPLRGTVLRDRIGDPSGEVLHDLLVASDVAELARLALVADDGHRQRPPLAGRADHVAGRCPRAVEEDLT